MCNRYFQTKREVGLTTSFVILPRYKIAPTDAVMIAKIMNPHRPQPRVLSVQRGHPPKRDDALTLLPQRIAFFAGFSLIELLVVIAIIVILSGMLLSTLVNAKKRATAIFCINNTKQLQLAWVLYNGDNNGRIVLNPGAVPANQTNYSWCVADEQPGAPAYTPGGETNINLFMHGLLGRYTQTPSLFRCPADKFVFPGAKGPFARNYSMNNWMNGYYRGTTTPRLYDREAQMVSPVGLFVFIHEDPNTIDDGTIAIDLGASTTNSWVNSNTAAALHSRAASIGFADGHAELHRWRSVVNSTGPIKGVPRVNTSINPSVDANWLKARTSEPK